MIEINLFYGRISSVSQNIERQVKKAKEMGVEDRFIFLDTKSGRDFERPKYQMMINMVREGDLIILDSLDRLGRSYDLIKQEWVRITRNLNADILILENETLFDSKKFKNMGDLGKLLEDQFLSLLAYLAEQERNKIRQRQAEGIQIAKSKGVKFGRKPKVTINDIAFINVYYQWVENKITATQSHKQLGIGRSNFYRLVNEYEIKNNIEESYKQKRAKKILNISSENYV